MEPLSTPRKWAAIPPTEENHYCLFAEELEKNPLVLFRADPQRNFDSIVTLGFRSAASLGIGGLRSVSYAKRSSLCLTHIRTLEPEAYVVFAVEFDSLDGVVVNDSDVYVYDLSIQPRILGYCELPSDFRVR